ncbi:nucleotide exchange factor GrpE [Aquimarina agarivorans]|uniref:nucleotide exchange factor GrpE n=1 Tax=Aquimarina agarivorans TaxID=980584 RepID=UPI000248FD70|nr:nucleotide exchange factor GrpE [Aquimarina agarivorans]
MSTKNKAKETVDEVIPDSNLENRTDQNEVKETVENNDSAVEEQDELALAKEAAAVEKDKFLRLFAEFENYKKRTSKERIELFKTAGQEVLQALLPVLDDFDRAGKEIEKSEDEALKQGVTLIHNKLKDILKLKGLEQVEVNSADTFDADIHEAITQIPAPSDDLKGKIIDVVEKGYKLGDKIIRYPKVVTGN